MPSSRPNFFDPVVRYLDFGVFAFVACVCSLALLMSEYIRQLTIEHRQYLADSLWLREEDIGGWDGIMALWKFLGKSSDDKNPQGKATIVASARDQLIKFLPEPETFLFKSEQILKPAELTGLLIYYQGKDKKEPIAKVGKRCNLAELRKLQKRKCDRAALCLAISQGFNGFIKGGTAPKNAPAEKLDLLQRRLALEQYFIGFVRCYPKNVMFCELIHEWLNIFSRKLVKGAGRHPKFDSQMLDDLIINRRKLDLEFDKIFAEDQNPPMDDAETGGITSGATDPGVVWNSQKASLDSREASLQLHNVRRDRLKVIQGLLLLFLPGFAYLLYEIATCNFEENGGLLSGTSIAFTLQVCTGTFILAIIFWAESYLQLKCATLYTSRLFRLPLYKSEKSDSSHKDWRFWTALIAAWRRNLHIIELPTIPTPLEEVSAVNMWREYQNKGSFWSRLERTLGMMIPYYVGMLLLLSLLGDPLTVSPTVHDLWVRTYFLGIVTATVIVFLLLTFWTIDSARLCRWFIRKVTSGPTEYPQATINHFKNERGEIEKDALAEYIDVKIIAEITQRVGSMLYFPAIILFLLVLAFNTGPYAWPWRFSWVLICGCHFLIAVLSIFILQRSARAARDASVAFLETKLQRARSARVTTVEERLDLGLNEAEKMLAEMRSLKSGAFVGFAGNPIIGAILIPWGGTIAAALLQYYFQR